MIQIKRFPKRVFLALILVLIVLSILSGCYFYFQKKVFRKSYTEANIVDRELRLNVSLDNLDKASFESFFKDLGVSPIYSLNLKFNDESINYLSKILPQRVNLNFVTAKDVKFQSADILVLDSSLVGEDWNFATSSGKLHLKKRTDQDFILDIFDPGALVPNATSSGKFYLSDKLATLYPILGKIATINLRVNGKSISGEIRLK